MEIMEERWMDEAVAEAGMALREGEVPVGAVVVRDDEIIGRGHNEIESRSLATAHAEMLAIEEAAAKIGDWRLDGSTLYVTIEPCHMCMGAVYLSRIARIVFGAANPRSGACGSIDAFHEAGLFNHEIEVTGGVRESECRRLLTGFFESLRE